MVAGDPYKFSIIADCVSEWNVDETFRNGILLFSLDGETYPTQMMNATLTFEIQRLVQRLSKCVINRDIFGKNIVEAFIEMYTVTYPESFDVLNDYCYEISPQIFCDNNFYFFAVSDGEKVRVMGTKLEYVRSESRHRLCDLTIKEVYITMEELGEIVSELQLFQTHCG